MLKVAIFLISYLNSVNSSEPNIISTSGYGIDSLFICIEPAYQLQRGRTPNPVGSLGVCGPQIFFI